MVGAGRAERGTVAPIVLVATEGVHVKEIMKNEGRAQRSGMGHQGDRGDIKRDGEESKRGKGGGGGHSEIGRG